MRQVTMLRLCALLLMPVFSQAQGIQLNSGAHWVTVGDPYVVLNNASLANNASFFADSGTVLFTGGSGSFIGGERPVAFHNLTLSHDVRLNNNILVTGAITMDSGNLQLNSYGIDLGSTGRIIGERNSSRITDLRGGTIKIAAVLNAPQAANPGNIGVELTSTANLGSIVIVRGHEQQTNVGETTSIGRWFDIIQQTRTDAPVRLRLFYLDGELAGKDKNALSVFSSDNHWIAWGKDAANPANNWVLKEGMLSARRFTLAVPSTGAGDLVIDVHTYPNPAHDRFSMQIVRPTAGNGFFYLYDVSGHPLEVKKIFWQAGTTTLDWDISKYAAGSYYLRTGDQNQKPVQIVKQ